MGVELDVFHQDPCEIGPPTLRAGARNPGATPSQSSGLSASTSTPVWLPRRLDASPRRVTSRISTGDGGRVTCDQIFADHSGRGSAESNTAGNAGASASRRIGLHVVCLLVDHNTGTARVEQRSGAIASEGNVLDCALEGALAVRADRQIRQITSVMTFWVLQ